jgi:probable F420-dependent oxidoreductase
MVMDVLKNMSFLLSNTADARHVLALSRKLNTWGFGRVWLPENCGLEAFALGGAIAASTELEVGTSIVPVYSRTPALLAMGAATISRLGNGRPMHLGIGAGGQVTVERWHGVPFEKTVTTVADTIAILREALSGEKTAYSGEALRSHGFRLMQGPPYGTRIHVGGMGPRMQALAAQTADGLIVTWLSPRVLRDFATGFRAAVDAAQRPAGSVELIARAYVVVCDDPATARESVRKELVEYLISPPYGRYFTSVGFGAEVERARAGFEARDRQRAVAAVSDALLDEVLIYGEDSSDVAEPLRQYFEAGADHLMIQPVPVERFGDPDRTIDAVGEVFA